MLGACRVGVMRAGEETKGGDDWIGKVEALEFSSNCVSDRIASGNVEACTSGDDVVR